MTRVTHCGECGDRERTGFMRDGECRECRGIDVSTHVRGLRARPLSWSEREAGAHREARNRARVVENRVNQS